MKEYKEHEVYLHHEMKLLGTQWGPRWGGVVTHPNGHDVVGVVRKHPEGDFYLDASQPHHTGYQYDGLRVSVSNRPVKS